MNQKQSEELLHNTQREEFVERLEDQLRESEQLLNAIVENSQAGIFVINDNYRITYTNDRFCEIVGYPYEQVIGEDFRKFVSADSREMVSSRYVRGQKGEIIPSRYEFDILRGDKVIRHVEISATVFKDVSNRVKTLAQILDITEHAKADSDLKKAHDELERLVDERTAKLRMSEDALRISEAKYYNLVENANSIILETDHNGNITYFNKFAQDFFGYTEEEIIGRNVIGTITPKIDSNGTDLELKLRDILEYPEKYYITENENMLRNGEIVWIAWTNKVLYNKETNVRELLSIGIDRTKLKHTEEALAEKMKEEVTEVERTRLAKELHDAVSQTLFSTSLIAEVLPRLWERNQEEGRKRLREIRQLTRTALTEMRTLLFELRPSVMTDVDLREILNQLSQSVTSRTQIPVKLTVSGTNIIQPKVKMVIYRVAQEALNNIAKHSRANQAHITLSSSEDQVTLNVVDNGVGFDLEKIPLNSFGIGIMKDRAQNIGAKLQIESNSGRGTKVTLVCST